MSKSPLLRRLILARVCIGTGILVSSCVPRAISPPAAGLPVDSPAVLRAAEVGVGGEGGGEWTLWGPEPAWASARVRIGAGGGVEVDARGTYAHGGFGDRPEVSPHLGAARIGARVEIARGVLTLAGGAGAGGAAIGPFVTADLGFVLGWENRYFVPFLAGSAIYSEPLGDAPVQVRMAQSDGTSRLVPLLPSRAAGFQASLGFRVPLETGDPRTRVSLMSVLGVTELWGLELEGTPHVGLIGGAGAIEVSFDALGPARGEPVPADTRE